MKYHLEYFRFIPSFYEKLIDKTDSDTATKINRHVKDSKQLLKVQMQFYTCTLSTLYQHIAVCKKMYVYLALIFGNQVLQKQTGGISDIVSTMQSLKGDFNRIGEGQHPDQVRQIMQKLNAAGIFLVLYPSPFS